MGINFFTSQIVHYVGTYENCPRYYNEMKEFQAAMNEQDRVWLEADRPIFDELEQLLGTTINTRTEIAILTDTIKTMLFLDCDISQWAKDAYYNTLKKYSDGSWARQGDNFIMTRIQGGPLLTEIVNNMVAVANNAESGKKVLLYSAHDVTVSNLGNALGVMSQIETISYGDAFMVDLVQSGTEEVRVEVVYLSKANAIRERIPINVPGCGFSCSLTTFRAATSEMMVADRHLLCVP